MQTSFKICCSVSCFAGIAARCPGTRVRPAGHTNIFPPFIHLLFRSARCTLCQSSHSSQLFNCIIIQHSTNASQSIIIPTCGASLSIELGSELSIYTANGSAVPGLRPNRQNQFNPRARSGRISSTRVCQEWQNQFNPRAKSGIQMSGRWRQRTFLSTTSV